MSQYKYFKSGIINRSSQYKKKQLTASNYKSTMEFIDFILVNCCLILNIKSVKKSILQVEIFKCTLSKVLHNLDTIRK